MTEAKLHDTVAIFLIVSHVCIPGLLLVVFVSGGLTREEFTTTMGITLPMVSALSALALTYVIGAKRKASPKRKSPEISAIYAFTSLLLPLAFVVVIVSLIVMKVFNRGFSSFEDFKLALTATDSIFGLYTGRMMASLFEKEAAK